MPTIEASDSIALYGRVLDWAAPGRAALVGGVSFGGLASLHFAHRVAAPAPSIIDELAGIDIPALVVVGEEDNAYVDYCQPTDS